MNDVTVWDLNQYIFWCLVFRIANGQINMLQLVYGRIEEIDNNDARQTYNKRR